MKIGVAGTVESNDCLITVEESDELEIIIESIVMEFFGEQIKKVIVDTLVELKIKTIKVTCNDKGALDYTIKSRLVTAIKRMEG
ncbi:MAG TPA: citrate lyase acyl carrier protein [Bacilli bacterium]|jgi:citrate lyase subunit gamma (acyl carrier protein)|nr:citrate lyase acyl carrier protein [Bacilli bacterium]HOE06074.1 citrate lyase acyl carrier protein [Bacilli bacterium]HOR17269.1 citrate lyase acyl carrier protein [Bacilli bacterium]HPL55361.1 citrate lyase acyl carrier protein [Bacilli bacterium]